MASPKGDIVPDSTLAQYSQYGASVSGLPAPFIQALIMKEATYNMPGKNNPFDITDAWAKLMGFAPWLTGTFGSQGNIATFSDPYKAIDAWWHGLSSPSWSYSKTFMPLVTKGGASAYQLANALQADSGGWYSAYDPGFANSIAQIYQNITGKSGYAPMDSTATSPTSPDLQPSPDPLITGDHAITNQTAAQAQTQAQDYGVIHTPIGDIAVPVLGAIGSEVQAIGSFLGAPDLLWRILLVLLGVLLLLLGLALFGLSFVDFKDVKNVGEAAAVA